MRCKTKGCNNYAVYTSNYCYACQNKMLRTRIKTETSIDLEDEKLKLFRADHLGVQYNIKDLQESIRSMPRELPAYVYCAGKLSFKVPDKVLHCAKLSQQMQLDRQAMLLQIARAWGVEYDC